MSFFSILSASGSGGGEEDQVPGGSAGGDPDEEAGDQTEALRGTRDHHGPRERGRKFKNKHLCFLLVEVLLASGDSSQLH